MFYWSFGYILFVLCCLVDFFFHILKIIFDLLKIFGYLFPFDIYIFPVFWIQVLCQMCVFFRKLKFQAGLNDKSAHTINCKIQTSGSVKSSFSLFSFLCTCSLLCWLYLRHSFSDGGKIAAVIPDLTSLNHTVQKEGGLA